jgi:hypothetical protein
VNSRVKVLLAAAGLGAVAAGCGNYMANLRAEDEAKRLGCDIRRDWMRAQRHLREGCRFLGAQFERRRAGCGSSVEQQVVAQ